MEVLVNSGACEAVEAINGGAQVRGGNPDLSCQLIEALGRVLISLFLHTLQESRLDGERTEVALVVGTGGDHPEIAAAIVIVHVVAKIDVGLGLVHEALAVRINEHHVGKRTLTNKEPPGRSTFLHWRERSAPPRIIHIIHRRTKLLRELDRHAQIAGIARGVASDVLVLLTPFLIGLEAAGAQHDALIGADHALGPILLDAHAHHAVALCF